MICIFLNICIVYNIYYARAEQLMRINGAMFQMSQTNSQLPVPNDHRYTQNIQDIISHINNNSKQILKKELAIFLFCIAVTIVAGATHPPLALNHEGEKDQGHGVVLHDKGVFINNQQLLEVGLYYKYL